MVSPLSRANAKPLNRSFSQGNQKFGKVGDTRKLLQITYMKGPSQKLRVTVFPHLQLEPVLTPQMLMGSFANDI